MCGAVSCSQGANNSFFGNTQNLDVTRTQRIRMFDSDRNEKNKLAFLLKEKRNAAREQAF